LRAKGGGKIKVDSAGTGRWHVGKSPHGPAIEAAALRGYDMRDLRARLFTQDDFEQFDLILAMDQQNLDYIEAMRPSKDDTPARLITSFDPTLAKEVPDPYYTGDFERALDLIEASSDALLRSLA
jgi:protein-tyrosine phosphatase